MLDAMTGNRPGFSGGGERKVRGARQGFGKWKADGKHSQYHPDSGGASRFFFRADYDEGE